MKKLYTLLSFVLFSFAANAQCTDLFISEYAEGSSSNKYLEIYNPSSSAVDLSGYSLYMINNGGTPNNIGFELSGTLAPNQVYVLANNAADPVILAAADTLLGYNSVCHFNGDDAVCLLKGTDTIDVIGERWVDPGSGWTVGTGSTKDYTLVRKSNVNKGDIVWTSASTQWDVLSKDDWNKIGTHFSDCHPNAPSTGAVDPTADAVDVISLFSGVYADVTVNTWRTGWSVATFEEVKVGGNDVKKYSALSYVGIEATGVNSIDASGMDYFTFDAWTPDATTYKVKLVDWGADNAFGGGDDVEHEITFSTPAQGSWTNHTINMSDFTGLTTSANISQIVFAAEPAGGATLFLDNIYFSRKPTSPSTGAADPTADAVDVISLFSGVYADVTVNTWRTGWSVATFEEVKVGGNDVKKYSALSYVGIEATGVNSIDASGMDYFTFDAWTPDATTYKVKLVDWGADNAFGGGDDVEHEITFSTPAQGSWTNHTINMSDFTGLTTSANISQIIFAAEPAGGATLFLDNIYFSRDPVLVYNVADIADIVGLDADFSPVNLDTLYEVTGIVYGIDYQGGDDLTNTNAAFTLIDATDGVGVFARGLDYVVKEGDEVTVKGKLDFFRGLTQIAADSITVVSTGNAINDPTDVTSLSEETESDLVKFTKVWLADASVTTWPSGNIDLTNGTDTFAVRVDSDTKGIAGKTIEFDTMNIVGLVGQFDRSAPYNEGYQLFPRDSSDISEWVIMTSVRNVSIQTSVYPNPASDNLTVVGSTKWESFVVYSILGGEIAAGTLNNNNLSVANLNNGTYIIKLVAGEQVGVARFVVSK
jgi:hypothetical protein